MDDTTTYADLVTKLASDFRVVFLATTFPADYPLDRYLGAGNFLSRQVAAKINDIFDDFSREIAGVEPEDRPPTAVPDALLRFTAELWDHSEPDGLDYLPEVG